MNAVDENRISRGFWVVLLLSLFAWAPALYPGYWTTLEGFVPIFNALHPSALATVATVPDLWRGMGSGTFLLAYPLTRLGLTPVTAVQLSFVCSFILAGLGTYVWLRPHLGDQTAALAGLLTLLFPPFLATVYVRGSLSDATILGLLPLVLAGVSRYAAARLPSAAGVAVIGILWMWRTQAGLALLATLLVLAYTLWVERDRLTVGVVLISGIAGLTSLIPVWHVRGPAPVQFGDHFVYPFQLLDNGWQVAPSIPGWQDGYPFQLGFAAVGFSLITLWLLWSRRSSLHQGTALAPLPRQRHQLWSFSFVGSALLILLVLPPSAPLWQWSGAHALLTYPWQLLLLTTPLLAVTGASLVSLDPNLCRLPTWASLLTLAVLSSFPYLSPHYTQVQPQLLPVASWGGAQFLLLSAELQQNTNPPQARLEVAWQTLQTPPFDYAVFFQALRPGPDEAGWTVVSQLDVQPLGGTRPATSWAVGEILTDTYILKLPQELDHAHELRFIFGYYDWRDGQRLPPDGADDDALVLYAR